MSHIIPATFENPQFGYRAFRVDRIPGSDRFPTLLARWILHLPGQNPVWSYYALMLCHLRDGDGLPPAQKHSPEFTHEVSVWAINPALSEPRLIAGDMAVLQPLNYVRQFVSTDEYSRGLAARLTELLVQGVLIAEFQGISGMREMYDRAIDAFLSDEVRPHG